MIEACVRQLTVASPSRYFSIKDFWKLWVVNYLLVCAAVTVWRDLGFCTTYITTAQIRPKLRKMVPQTPPPRFPMIPHEGQIHHN